MSALKAYLFPHNQMYTREDVLVVATSRESAISHLGDYAENYFKSKISIVHFEIESIEKRVFRHVRFNNNKHEKFIDEDINATASFNYPHSQLEVEFSNCEKTKDALEKEYILFLKEVGR